MRYFSFSKTVILLYCHACKAKKSFLGKWYLNFVTLRDDVIEPRDNEQNRTRSSYAMARKRAMKWTDLHLRPRVESITDDNVESNCSMIRKYSSKRSEFLRFNLYFCHVYR